MKKFLFLIPIFCLLLTAWSSNAFAEEKKPEPVPTKIELVKSKVAPGGKHAKNKGVIAFFEIAKMIEEGKFDEGIKACEGYIKKNKDQPIAVYFCAVAFLEKGDTEKVTELLKLADKTNPG